MESIRVAVVGAGQFGRNHLRILRELPQAELAAVVDCRAEAATQAASEFGCRACAGVEELEGLVDAAVVAVPTTSHAEVGCRLLEAGIDVLVEKPIAPSLDAARRLGRAAATHGRILQVGHLERFNPAVRALEAASRLPLFFEVHRLSVFTPRSLDVDVVLDLMIHDLEIVLSLARQMPSEIRASGIRILSEKVDIANVRLAFPDGCVANLTASRVSTERVRKLRLFQPHEYISVDYSRQDGVRITVSPERKIGFQPLDIVKGEPLRLQDAAFLESVRTRTPPLVGAVEATRALEVAEDILGKIEEHVRTVAETLSKHGFSSTP